MLEKSERLLQGGMIGMNEAAKAFWRMYYLNVLKREKMITQEEFAELAQLTGGDILPRERAALYNGRGSQNKLPGG